MEKNLLKITSVALLIFFSCQLNAQNKIDLKTVSDLAENNLQTTLEKIPVGNEQGYGFNSRSEFASAKLVTLPICEYDGNNMTAEFNKYRFLVSVNGEARAVISYCKDGSNWLMCGFGSTGLANEFKDLVLKSMDQVAMVKLVRVSDLNFKGDFVTYESAFTQGAPVNGLIPMESSKISPQLKSTSKTTYTLQEVLKLGVGEK